MNLSPVSKRKVTILALSILLTLLVAFIPAAPAQASCPPWYCTSPNWGFETGDLSRWTVSGDAFSVTNDTTWGWGGDFNHKGTYHVWGAKYGDDKTGTLRSESFTTSQQGYVDFLVGGGNNLDQTYVALIDESNGLELYRATGKETELYHRVVWAVPAGKTLHFLVVDSANGSWGHVNVDDFHTPGASVYTSNYTHLANHDFEYGDLRGWRTEGTAFAAEDVASDSTYWGGSFNQNGNYHLWSYKTGGDADTGVLTSKPFTLGGLGQIDFLVSGGSNQDLLYVALVRVSDGRLLFKTGASSDTEQYSRVTWDGTEYAGEEVYLKVVDEATDSWGHINIDDVNVQVKPQTELPNHDFNSGLKDWTVVSGNAFQANDITSELTWSKETFWSNLPSTYIGQGLFHLWGYRDGGDGGVGVLKSDNFILGSGSSMPQGGVSFLIGGGNDINNLYVALVSALDGAELFKATGENSESYRLVQWDASAYIGKEVYIKVVDNATGSWGHVNLDEVRLSADWSKYGSFNYIDEPHLKGWNIVSGDAFSEADATSDTWWGGMFYQNGRTYLQDGKIYTTTQANNHLWGYKDGGDGQVGVLKSKNFILGTNGNIDFLIGGGNDINNLYVALVRASDGEVLFKATGANSETYRRVSWNASAYAETECYFKVVDNATGGWGHVNLDDVNVSTLY